MFVGHLFLICVVIIIVLCVKNDQVKEENYRMKKNAIWEKYEAKYEDYSKSKLKKRYNELSPRYEMLRLITNGCDEPWPVDESKLEEKDYDLYYEYLVVESKLRELEEIE